jgi:hypothetical protein
MPPAPSACVWTRVAAAAASLTVPSAVARAVEVALLARAGDITAQGGHGGSR